MISAELPGRANARGGGVWLRDMNVNDSDRFKDPVPERRIAGPLMEFDKYDQYTGYDYFRCRRCGRESLRRIDLEGCCE